MQTRQESLLSFIGDSATQLLIPVYQRVYSWSAKQCDTLWDDIMRAGRAGNPHFVGTVLYAPEPADPAEPAGPARAQNELLGVVASTPSSQNDAESGEIATNQLFCGAQSTPSSQFDASEPANEGGETEAALASAPAPAPSDPSIEQRLDVIDGQQRMVTTTLLLLALRDLLSESPAAQSALDALGVDADFIDRRYLHIADQPKIILSRMDRATMDHVLDGAPLPDEDDVSAKVLENHGHFLAKLRDLPADQLPLFWQGLQLLVVVLAKLDGDDRAQLIFESLNAKGMPLTTTDLVRNLLLVNCSLEEQNRLYQQYWEPIEKLYANDPDSTRLNAALHGWLAVTAPKLKVKDKDQVYSAFKQHLETERTRSTEDILIGLRKFCQNFASKSSGGAKVPRSDGGWVQDTSSQLISNKKLFGE